jgi:hypothetical protein
MYEESLNWDWLIFQFDGLVHKWRRGEAIFNVYGSSYAGIDVISQLLY